MQLDEIFIDIEPDDAEDEPTEPKRKDPHQRAFSSLDEPWPAGVPKRRASLQLDDIFPMIMESDESGDESTDSTPKDPFGRASSSSDEQSPAGTDDATSRHAPDRQADLARMERKTSFSLGFNDSWRGDDFLDEDPPREEEVPPASDEELPGSDRVSWSELDDAISVATMLSLSDMEISSSSSKDFRLRGHKQGRGGKSRFTDALAEARSSKDDVRKAEATGIAAPKNLR